MTTLEETLSIAGCLEGFFYGKISILCVLTCITLAKEVQLFPGQGLYSGIFAMYLFTLLIEQLEVQDGNHPGPFICSLSSLRSIYVSDLVAIIPSDLPGPAWPKSPGFGLA